MARTRDWSKGLTDKEIEYMRSLTDAKIKSIKKRHCVHCIYFMGTSSNLYDRYCDYLDIVGHDRPCLPGKCKQKGVWKAKDENIKRKRRRTFESGATLQKKDESTGEWSKLDLD